VASPEKRRKETCRARPAATCGRECVGVGGKRWEKIEENGGRNLRKFSKYETVYVLPEEQLIGLPGKSAFLPGTVRLLGYYFRLLGYS